MIELKSVRLQRGNFQLGAIDLTIGSEEYAVLMGGSGAGKTTLLMAICGLLPIESGRIWIAGQEVGALPPEQRSIGYVPQDAVLFPTMGVAENLSFALAVRGCSREERRERAAAMAEQLGIGALLDRSVDGLSGGERQRVALGRALLAQPQVLLLDEPLAALDEERWQSALDLLLEVHRESAVSVLHVTHRRQEAEALGARRFRIEGGSLSEDTENRRG